MGEAGLAAVGSQYREAAPSATSGDRFLELDFGGEAVAITPDRQHRQFAAALPVSHRAVLRRKASVNLDAVPMRGVPDIVELAIEEVLGTSFPWCSSWAAELKELFAAYIEAKQRRNVLDYDDLL